MARPKVYTEAMVSRLVAGTLERIRATLNAEEDSAGFVRLAIDRELRRREKFLKTPPKRQIGGVKE